MKTTADLRKMMAREPGRYQPATWTVMYDHPRWSDRPAGEPAYIAVDDLHTQTTLHFRGVPEDDRDLLPEMQEV